MDWTSAQQQITGWQKPRHRCFSTRVEAQRFLDSSDSGAAETASELHGDSIFSVSYNASEVNPEPHNRLSTHKKVKQNANCTKPSTPVCCKTDFEPGMGPLPPDAEDGFDPNICLDPQTGEIIYKPQAKLHSTKLRPSAGAQTEPIRIYTDGSSLGNGETKAVAGVGVYFGPGDKRSVLIGRLAGIRYA